MTATSAVLACARPTEFSTAVERMEQEHAGLTAQLTDLYLTAKTAESAKKETGGRDSQFLLVRRVDGFQTALEAHLQWARKELFPMMGIYAGEELEPSIKPSLWGLDKDFQLAKTYLDAFRTTALHDGPTTGKEETAEAVTHLLQACVILSDYLKMEKDLMFPLADQMLTDIDYLFS
jgi:hypothetical protein